MNRPQAPPVHLVREAFDLDPDAPSGLRWRQRPREHFATDQSWRFWLRRYSGRPVAGCASGRGGDLRVGLTVDRRLLNLPVRRVRAALIAGAWPEKRLRRESAS
jgi:hypothetical protein